jgi:hypothetical protein
MSSEEKSSSATPGSTPQLEILAHGGIKENVTSYYQIRRANGRIDVSKDAPRGVKLKAKLRNLFHFLRG